VIEKIVNYLDAIEGIFHDQNITNQISGGLRSHVLVNIVVVSESTMEKVTDLPDTLFRPSNRQMLFFNLA
jgi:hypothetical protein